MSAPGNKRSARAFDMNPGVVVSSPTWIETILLQEIVSLWHPVFSQKLMLLPMYS